MAGGAVGLGNIWRFPYLVGQNGGAAFICIYLVIILLVSLPIFICEFVIGKRGRANACGSFRKLAPGTKWHLAGTLGVLTSFFILTFYCVIGGWSTDYLIRAIRFGFRASANPDFDAMFASSVTTAWRPLLHTLLFLAMAVGILLGGIKGGIEKFSKVMMPVLFVLMVGIAIFSMCLPGSGEGIRYLFKPDFSKVTGQTVVQALGQAFFSLSLGMGGMITYASYASPDENAAKCSLTTALFDTIFAIIAGCAVMPAVFAFGGNPESGPGLVFLTLPRIFEAMPCGGVVAIVFFLSLLLAAVSSAVSLAEVVISFIIEEFNMNRSRSAATVFVTTLAISILNSLSQGAVPGLSLFGKNLIDLLDYTTANIMMTTCSLLTVIFVGWKFGKEAFVDEITNHGTLGISRKLTETVFFLIKYLIPVVIVLIMVSSL